MDPLTFIQILPGYLRTLVDVNGKAVYTEAQIAAEVHRVLRQIEASGFGYQTPYYYEVLGGYAQMQQWQQQAAPEPYLSPNVQVVTQGGRQYGYIYDTAGNLIDIRDYGVAEPEGLTAWQQTQLDLDRQQFAFQQQQAQWQRQQAMMPYGQMTAYEQAQMALQQQAYAAQTAALPAESWIEQWYRTHPKPTPTTKKKKTTMKEREFKYAPSLIGAPTPEVAEYIKTKPSDIVIAKTASEAGKMGATSWIPVEQWAPAFAQNIARIQAEAGGGISPATGLTPEQQRRMAGVETMWGIGTPGAQQWPLPTGAGGGTVKSVKIDYAPPAPPWLSEFAPSQRTGQPITKAPITTPSGQQWMAAPPTVQAGLAGYGTWAGYNLEDILAQMYRMQPQTPAGAGRQGWMPTYQYA